ncbi:4Fe-4S dicluster domain-containing protein [Evansella tamaricis]|uniref:4Fe-4S binding protein n=1 Tax=Evansella tamaricis TaxID=2069301 RepID=A0ABS6JF87_9BACI|nr:4Fe-4S binding protein [Evansella tamaricis]
MKQFGFLFDLDRCTGCNACVISCLNENCQSSRSLRRVILANNKFFLSISCNHCSQPECLQICPKIAFKKRDNGVVELNHNRCDGCGLCVTVCPYGAIQVNSLTGIVEKCNMCNIESLESNLPPCIQACQTSALQLSNLYSEIHENVVTDLEGFPNPHITKPSLRIVSRKMKRNSWNN